MIKKKITILVPSKDAICVGLLIYGIASLVAFVCGAMEATSDHYYLRDCTMNKPVKYVMAPAYMGACYLFTSFEDKK